MNATRLIQTDKRSRPRWPFQRPPPAWLPALTLCLLGSFLTARGQDPLLTNTNYPLDSIAGPGGTVTFAAYAGTTDPPLTYQWQHEGTNLPGANLFTLSIANVTQAHAGGYMAWVTNASGNFTNTRTATLTVYPAFTKITTGPVATDTGLRCMTPAWGDLNNDGYLDLIIADMGTTADYPFRIVTRAAPLVHLNNQDGTFRRATEADIGPLATNAVAGGMAVLADYDNDGYLDFYQQAWLETNNLWRGGADGKFSLVTENVGPNIQFAGSGCWGYGWADYNQDGFVDLYVTTAWTADGTVDYLYPGKGDGTFAAPLDMGNTPDSEWPCWADYDNDGDPDVAVEGHPGRLYRNDGGGTFTEVTGLRGGMSWGDYDNDGDLDKFGLNGLYENDGAGGFTKRSGPASGLCAWVDIDNDGYLDLYVGDFSAWLRRLYRFDPATKTFKEFTLAPLTSDPMKNAQVAWADYDNDGFMDVVIASGGLNANRLYRNNGNGNHWLQVKPIGTTSNRSAIGARVIAETVIFGQTLRQMREIEGYLCASTGRAHFGLGDATNVTTLRIQWPSGTVQELANVAANQILTVVEPRRPVLALEATPSGFTGRLQADPEQTYQLQASEDLAAGWTVLTNVTADMNGTASWSDPGPTPAGRRFYKALKTP